ncbi:MAG: hypothetical protein ACRDP6_37250 [Actinoallomurus sp.]
MTSIIAFPSAAGAPTPVVTATIDQVVVVQLLAARWPVGARVRHVHSMWIGTIVPGTPEDCPGAYVGVAPAHCYVPNGAREPGLVCVTWDHPNTQRDAADRTPYAGPWPHPQIGPAWMRQGLLRLARDRTAATR